MSVAGPVVVVVRSYVVDDPSVDVVSLSVIAVVGSDAEVVCLALVRVARGTGGVIDGL